MEHSDQDVVADTRAWLERAVIGLNLCPFAKGVHVKGLVHIAVSPAVEPGDLLQDLDRELLELVGMDAHVRETTLLVAPAALREFLEFNDFLNLAQRLIRKRRLQGVVQLPSFHPAYQFSGTAPDDVTNFTNRSPYPTFHLLRESSVERAVQAFPQAAEIYETNMRTLRALGPDGWAALNLGRSK